MSVSVVFPEELLVASKEDHEQFARRVMIYTLGQLYQEGKISSYPLPYTTKSSPMPTADLAPL